MSINNLNLVVGKVEGNSRKDLLNALRKLAEIDADFNGENGEDYLWEEVVSHNEQLEEGNKDYFDSNMEYLLNELKELNGEDLVETYLEEWIGRDGYWIDYKFEIVLDDKIIKSISLATIS